MAAFQDANGKEWELKVSVQSAFNLKEDGAVDLLDIMSDQKKQADFFRELCENPAKAIRVAYVLCRPRIERDGMTAEEFCESLDGNSLEQIPLAVMEAVADFFPKGHREVAQRLVAAMRKEVDRLNRMNQRKLASLNLEAMLTAEVDKQISGGLTSLDSAATSELTPAGSVSG